MDRVIEISSSRSTRFLYLLSIYLAFYSFIPTLLTNVINILILVFCALFVATKGNLSNKELLVLILLGLFFFMRQYLLSGSIYQNISILLRFFFFIPLSFLLPHYNKQNLYKAIWLFYFLASIITLLSYFFTGIFYTIATSDTLASIDRGYGFLLSPSSSSIVLIATYWLGYSQFHVGEKNLIKPIALITLILDLFVLGSGTGYIFFTFSILMYLTSSLTYDINKVLNQLSVSIKSLLTILAVMIISIAAAFSSLQGLHRKIGIEYINFLIQLKQDQLNEPSLITVDFKNVDFTNPLCKYIGITDLSAGFGSDFGWGLAYLYLGLFGLILLLFLTFLLLSRNKLTNYLCIICLSVLLLSAFHYPAIFTMPGSTIFALAVSIRR
jgi:hypothetical protein